MKHNAEQTRMVWGALNSMEQKMDLTCDQDWNGKLSGKGDGIKYLMACGIKNTYVMLSEKKNGVGYSAKYNSEKIAGNQK